MELEFAIDEGDRLAFIDHHSQHSEAARAIRKRQTYGHAVLLAVFGLIFWFLGAAALGVAILVLGPVWVAWWPARARRLVGEQAAAMIREGSQQLSDGLHALRLEHTGLVYAAPTAEIRLPFSSVQHVVKTPNHLFIYVVPAQAIIVARQRVSRGDVDTFVQELQQRVGGSGP